MTLTPPKTALQYLGPVRNILNGPGYSRRVGNEIVPLIDPNLIIAIVWQESAGVPWAYRPEPRYRWLWDVKADKPFRKVSDQEIESENAPEDFCCLTGSRNQEWWAQQASWGLMQIMGACAREQNFKGPYLTELCDPYVNLEFGIKHLWQYAFQHGGRSQTDALLRWNGGNPDYPGQVLEKMKAVAASL